MLPQENHYQTNFDKLAAYHNSLQNTKGSFSVNHLLDLGEIPGENCAMFGCTEPSPGLPTQTCTPDSPNNLVHGDGQPPGMMTDLDLNCQTKRTPEPKEEPTGSPQGDANSSKLKMLFIYGDCKVNFTVLSKRKSHLMYTTDVGL